MRMASCVESPSVVACSVVPLVPFVPLVVDELVPSVVLPEFVGEVEVDALVEGATVESPSACPPDDSLSVALEAEEAVDPVVEAVGVCSEVLQPARLALARRLVPSERERSFCRSRWRIRVISALRNNVRYRAPRNAPADGTCRHIVRETSPPSPLPRGKAPQGSQPPRQRVIDHKARAFHLQRPENSPDPAHGTLATIDS